MKYGAEILPAPMSHIINLSIKAAKVRTLFSLQKLFQSTRNDLALKTEIIIPSDHKILIYIKLCLHFKICLFKRSTWPTRLCRLTDFTIYMGKTYLDAVLLLHPSSLPSQSPGNSRGPFFLQAKEV